MLYPSIERIEKILLGFVAAYLEFSRWNRLSSSSLVHKYDSVHSWVKELPVSWTGSPTWPTMSVTEYQACQLRGMDTQGRLSVIFDKGDNFCDSVFFPAYQPSSENGSTLKGKNLLPWSKFSPFYSRLLFRR